ncbi:MAG: hypothetical protein ACI85O_000965 [Saprospiraceae bacterium]|jgi:hypothetical protein
MILRVVKKINANSEHKFKFQGVLEFELDT